MTVNVGDIYWQITGTASELSQLLRRIDRHPQTEAKTKTVSWCQSKDKNADAWSHQIEVPILRKFVNQNPGR